MLEAGWKSAILCTLFLAGECSGQKTRGSIRLPTPESANEVEKKEPGLWIKASSSKEVSETGGLSMTVIRLKNRSEVNLTCGFYGDKETLLTWHAMSNYNVGIGHHKGFNSLSMLFREIFLPNRGVYECMALSSDGETVRTRVFLDVIQTFTCAGGFFHCKLDVCIIYDRKCDGVLDCPTGHDESFQTCGPDPCKGKITCLDGRCIDPNQCCDSTVDAECFNRNPCCYSIFNYRQEFENMDEQYVQISEEKKRIHSTIITVIACLTVFFIILGAIFVIGLYHSRNAWACQRRDQTRVRNTYYISNRVQTVDHSLHRPPSYRTIFGNDDPPPPYTEELCRHFRDDFEADNNEDINVNSQGIVSQEIEMRLREDHYGERGSSSDETL